MASVVWLPKQLSSALTIQNWSALATDDIQLKRWCLLFVGSFFRDVTEPRTFRMPHHQRQIKIPLPNKSTTKIKAKHHPPRLWMLSTILSLWDYVHSIHTMTNAWFALKYMRLVVLSLVYHAGICIIPIVSSAGCIEIAPAQFVDTNFQLTTQTLNREGLSGWNSVR